MSNYMLKREELLMLLKKMGIVPAMRMSNDFLPPLAEGDELAEGDFSIEELALAQVIAKPDSVVNAIRFDEENNVQEDVWFYIAGENFATLSKSAAGYKLSAENNLEALFMIAGSVLPLRSDSDTVHAKAVLDPEEFIEVRSLLRDWDKVSGEAILEADGMKAFEAINLAEAVESEEWHGNLYFQFYDDNELVAERSMWVLQGPDSAWMGYQDVASGKMVVQSANDEIMSDISFRIWEALDES
jgi:hypothetical protein